MARSGYFDELCRAVGIAPGGAPYRRLAEFLMDQYFYFDVPGDLNRVMEALGMRHGYSDVPPNDGACTVFEMLVSLSREMGYLTEGMGVEGTSGEPERWFLEMLSNLGISMLDDDFWRENTRESETIAEESVRFWMDREYDYDGHGGLFPLDHAEDDQGNVEIWYQMNAYILEKLG